MNFCKKYLKYTNLSVRIYSIVANANNIDSTF